VRLEERVILRPLKPLRIFREAHCQESMPVVKCDQTSAMAGPNILPSEEVRRP